MKILQNERQKQKALPFFFQKRSGSNYGSNPLKSANEKKSDGSRENFGRNGAGEKDAACQTVSGNISSYTNHTKQIYTSMKHWKVAVFMYK